MMLDNLTYLSQAQVVTADADSTYAYDGAAAQGGLTGIGEEVEAVILVTARTMNSQTCTVTLYSDDDNAGTNKTTIGSVVIPSSVAVGEKFVIDIPANDNDGRQSKFSNRYYYLHYVFSGTTITLKAWLQPSSMVQNNSEYPKSGYTIK